jgi:hypothetical protein
MVCLHAGGCCSCGPLCCRHTNHNNEQAEGLADCKSQALPPCLAGIISWTGKTLQQLLCVGRCLYAWLPCQQPQQFSTYGPCHVPPSMHLQLQPSPPSRCILQGGSQQQMMYMLNCTVVNRGAHSSLLLLLLCPAGRAAHLLGRWPELLSICTKRGQPAAAAAGTGQEDGTQLRNCAHHTAICMQHSACAVTDGNLASPATCTAA